MIAARRPARFRPGGLALIGLAWLAMGRLATAQDLGATDDPQLLAARDEANQLAREQRWDAAIAAGSRLLERLRTQLGPEHAGVAAVEEFLGRARLHLGENALAETHFRRALALHEKTLPPTDPAIASALLQLGRCLRAQQRLADALPPLGRALQIRRAEADADGLEVLAAFDELAGLHSQRGDFASAEKLHLERLAATENRFGPADLETAKALILLATTATAQNQPAAAEPSFRRALAIREKALLGDDPRLAESLTDLGWCLKNLGRYEAAQTLLQRALDWSAKYRGPGHEETAASARLLGWVFRLQRNFTAALPLFAQALAIRERTLGVEAPSTFQSLVELADLHWLRGAFDLAEPLYLLRRTRVERSFGPESEEMAAAEYSLALLYETSRRWPEAQDAAERLRALQTRLRGANDAQTMGNVFVLARVYFGAGDFRQAQRCYAEVATWFDAHPDADPARQSETLRQLAAAAFRAQPTPAAEPFFLEARRWHEHALAPTDPKTLSCLGDLAAFYEATARPARALAVAKDLLGRVEQVFAADASATLAVLERLAHLHEALAHRPEATALRRRLLDATRRRAGPDAEATLDALHALAGWLEQGGDWAGAEPLRRERVEILERKSGPASAPTAAALADLAALETQLGHFDAARPLLERQVQILAKLYPEDRVARPAVAERLAEVCQAAGDLGATAFWREEVVRRLGVDDAPAHLWWAEALQQYGRTARAAEVLATTQRLALAAQPPQTEIAARALCGLTAGALAHDRAEAAGAFFQQLASLLPQLSAPGPELAAALEKLGQAFVSRQDEARAQAAFRGATGHEPGVSPADAH